MPFYIRDLSFLRFLYLWAPWTNPLKTGSYVANFWAGHSLKYTHTHTHTHTHPQLPQASSFTNAQNKLSGKWQQKSLFSGFFPFPDSHWSKSVIYPLMWKDVMWKDIIYITWIWDLESTMGWVWLVYICYGFVTAVCRW
jgi:hypothetical protein